MFVSALHEAAAVSQRERILLARRGGDAGGALELPDKLGAIKAATDVFANHRISYALIGSLAVGIRGGVPRAAFNVDFAVPMGVARPDLATAMAACGFRVVGEFTHSLNFQHESGEPVQLASDVAFDAMIERAETMTFGDLELRVVTTADLIAMKRRAANDPGRRRSKALRDAADIALLEGDRPEPNEGW